MAEDAVCPVKNCELTVDIVLKSSDGCLIGAHHDNLAHFSEAFPHPGSVKTTATPVELPEDAKTLNLLMRFMHHHRLPTLSEYTCTFFKLPPELFSLAEAAEKYLVYSAMAMCNIRITDAVRLHPLQCLAYAIKFDYPDLVDEAAHQTLSSNVDDVMRHLGTSNSSAVLAWVRYRDRYLQLAEETIKAPTKTRQREHRCEDPTGHWVRFYKAVLAELPQSPLELIGHLGNGILGFPLRHCVQQQLRILDGCPRGLCERAAWAWVEQCTRQFDSIGKFSTFLKDG